VKHQIAEAQKIADGGGSEADVAEAKIELDVSQPVFSILSNIVAGS
jgi:F-type H+-transporting ATPase subunit delta